jgi:ubiquinone/menaquinone biosynthesis C-methylase UbiE
MVLSDISQIMLGLTGDAYRGARVRGLVRADVTALPLADGTFSCSIYLGLMHRVPAEIRRAAMRELARVTSGHLIVSFSAFDRARAAKRAVIRQIRPNFQFGSHPTTMDELRREFAEMGMRLVRIYRAIPFVSSEVVALLDVG